MLPLPLLCGIVHAQTAEVFPMQKGTHWNYRGEVTWTEGASVQRTRLNWDTQVADSMQRGRYRAALLIGYPSDLAFYEKGRQRGCSVVLSVDEKVFYRRQCAPSASREKLTLTDSDLGSIAAADNLIFRLPIRPGDSFGGDASRAAKDGMYAWNAKQTKQVAAPAIRGISGSGPWTEYTLTYRTNPDSVSSTYIPGIGLTSYKYTHHGTVSDVDVKLIELRRPSAR